MKEKTASGQSPRKIGKPCFCDSLNQLMAALPKSLRGRVKVSLGVVALSERMSNDWEAFQAGVNDLAETVSGSASLRRQLVGILGAPLAEDCSGAIYMGVAQAVADIVCHFPGQSAKAAKALAKNLAGNSWLHGALASLAPGARESVLAVLHDGLCADTDLAFDADIVLGIINPNWVVVKAWLGSSFPGPRAAMLLHLAESRKFPERFPAAAAKAMADPDPTLRSVVADAICRFEFCDTLKPVLLAALDDPDLNVRSAAGFGLFQRSYWAKQLLPELIGVLLKHSDDLLRTHVARAIGQLTAEGASAVTALKTVAKEGKTKVGKAARNALTLVNAG